MTSKLDELEKLARSALSIQGGRLQGRSQHRAILELIGHCRAMRAALFDVTDSVALDYGVEICQSSNFNEQRKAVKDFDAWERGEA